MSRFYRRWAGVVFGKGGMLCQDSMTGVTILLTNGKLLGNNLGLFAGVVGPASPQVTRYPKRAGVDG